MLKKTTRSSSKSGWRASILTEKTQKREGKSIDTATGKEGKGQRSQSRRSKRERNKDGENMIRNKENDKSLKKIVNQSVHRKEANKKAQRRCRRDQKELWLELEE